MANELKKHGGNYHVLGYIDDDRTKHKQVIQGFPQLGGRDKLLQLAKEKDFRSRYCYTISLLQWWVWLTFAWPVLRLRLPVSMRY